MGSSDLAGVPNAMVHERDHDDYGTSCTPGEVLQVYAIRLAALRGRRVSAKAVKRKLSPEQLKLWHELAMGSAIVLQDRLIAMALNGVRQPCLVCLATGRLKDGRDCAVCKGRGVVRAPADPRIVKLAADASIDIKDRVLGKATERIQIAQAVKVVMQGVDMNRLPDPQDQPTEDETE